MSSNDALRITDENFQTEVLESRTPCLVDFWAEWCRPCLMIAPAVEEIAREYQGKVKIAKVNVDEAGHVSSDYGIMSIPTLAVFKDGELVDKMVGASSKSAIEEFIKPHLA
ncbi:MAG: thioredoxin [Candidatus Aureabacteria bacterium]|nr:thioredoxin [Candidatus Auribacterota bacterium]